MASDDLDRAEVDRLVTELANPPKPPARRSAFAALLAETTSTKGASEPAQTDVVLTAQHVAAPGRAWTTANVLMPATRIEPRKRVVPRFVPPTFIALPKGFALPRRLSVRALRQAAMKKWRQTQWSAATVRSFVGLSVLLAGAMSYWPYAHAWSWGLACYLCASEFVVVTGIWGAKLTWDAHLPAAHTVSVGTTIWGLGLMAVETIPRLTALT